MRGWARGFLYGVRLGKERNIGYSFLVAACSALDFLS